MKHRIVSIISAASDPQRSSAGSKFRSATVSCTTGTSDVFRSLVRYQSPEPGFGEKYRSLSAFPSHSFQSGGGTLLTVIFGQIFAYSAFSASHFSSPGSVSALMASTGHSGSQTPQSMHSSGWEHILALVEAVHGAHRDAIHGFAANAAFVDDESQFSTPNALRRATLAKKVVPYT